jgi:hypothetical protein
MSFIYFPHGVVLDQWTPRTGAAGLELPPILEPLAPFRDRLTVISGLENQAAIAPPVHAITPATWLSCARPGLSPGAQPAGVTLDQLVARKLGQDMPFDSIQVATEVGGGEGSSDSRCGDAHARTISFRASSSPLPMEHDPRKLFGRLFGQNETRVAEGSVLDLVREGAADLSRTLGGRDKAVLADYLANIRAIERRVNAFVPAAVPDRSAQSREPSRQDLNRAATTFDEHIRLMFDLIALAYEANATRVATFMMAAEVSNQHYDFVGVPESFHSLSHHGNSLAKLARLARVQACNTALFAEFVAKLAAMPDGDGSMLDHSLIVYGSNMGNSNRHDHSDLPLALLGGACGKLSGNRHVRCPEPTPLANLHLTLLNKAGIPASTFGDSTGELAQL